MVPRGAGYRTYRLLPGGANRARAVRFPGTRGRADRRNHPASRWESNLTAIGLGFAGLPTIAADPKRKVILVAGGDGRRFVPLRAALRARLASMLVSDTVTARFLVEEG